MIRSVSISESGVKIKHNETTIQKADGHHNSEHYYSKEETMAFTQHIINCVSHDPLVARHFPMDPDSEDIFERLGDGLILTKMINLGYPGTIDEKKINKGANLSIYQKQENLNLILPAAKKIGCQIVNIGGQDIIAGKPTLILGLLWQVIKQQLLAKLSLTITENPDAAFLMSEGESEEAFAKLPPEQILLRWMNYHLKKHGETKPITNFDRDLKDPRIFCKLLHQLDPSISVPDEGTDELAVAEHAINGARRINVETFHQPHDIISGNAKLNMGFVAQIFNVHPNLESEESERQRLAEEEAARKAAAEEAERIEREEIERLAREEAERLAREEAERLAAEEAERLAREEEERLAREEEERIAREEAERLAKEEEERLAAEEAERRKYTTLDWHKEGTSCSEESVVVLTDVLAEKEEAENLRRWFHMHPELSMVETNTAAKVASVLRSYGLTEVFENCGKTGVVGLIRGEAGEGPCVALRADMDALPITETSDVPYKSQNVGVMHACGHDGHMAGLLTAAKILFEQRGNMKGTVKLIFQPGEEGSHGAREMIDDGVLEDGRWGPRVDSIYGLHLWSFESLGVVCVSDGPVMGASDLFEITVKGSGGHGAAPHISVDAIVEAAHLVTSLQTIVSRNIDPLESAVVTCGTISGGYNHNIIADSVKITGTTRSMTKAVQQRIKTRMTDICCACAMMHGGEINLDYQFGYPPTVNSYPECVEIVKSAATKLLGKERGTKPMKTMGAEDFSYFLEKRPGCFFFVGAALSGEIRPHHKSVFDFDERALMISASMFVQIIRNLL